MRERGMTLVEILVVLLVISLLAAALYVGFGPVARRGSQAAACQFGGMVEVALADRARERLTSLQEALMGLGLPTAPAPQGETGTWYDCATGGVGQPPRGTVCRVAVVDGVVKVYTWRDPARRCLNGRPVP